MSLIDCSQLSKWYGQRRGVDGIDFILPAATLCGVLGPNGAGKSTLIRILVGLIQASSGAATIAGRDCWKARQDNLRDIGYLPGDVRLWPWLTGAAGLKLIEDVRGESLSKRWRTLSELFELPQDVKVRDMSRGMRQKLGILMALSHQSNLLVLDEPTSGLDPVMQRRLMAELKQRAQTGTTVLFSSHTLSEVESLCDQIVIIRQGQIVADEPIHKLKQQAKRLVRVLWQEEPPSQVPVDVAWSQRSSKMWVGEFEGSSSKIAAWALDHGASDLSFESPNLERLFHSYYQVDP